MNELAYINCLTSMLVFFPLQIPEVIYRIMSLTTLYLRFNRIKEVSDTIKNLVVCISD